MAPLPLPIPAAATIDVDVDITDSVFDFAVGYRLVEKPLGDGSRTLLIEPFAGGRYHYLKQEIDLSAGGSPITTLGGSEDWVEPIVGGRIALVLTEKLKFLLRGDVGGFGIGSASDLTWNLIAALDFQPWEKTSLKLGYRHFDMDYEKGSGTRAFGFDGQIYGPQVGVTFYF
jgi:opacity protein-like surface antigen